MIGYKVDGKVFEDPSDVADYVFTEDDIDEREYDDMLDEVYEEPNICGMYYNPSYALKEVDPTAYRCGLADWRYEKYTEMRDELIEQVEALEPGDDDYVNDYYVECFEERNDEDDDDDDEDDDEEEETNGK